MKAQSPSRSRCIRSLMFAAVITIGGSAAASAQTTAPEISGGPTQVVSANPFTLMFKWFNAEYERKFTPNLTWGASGTFFPIGDFRYKNANAMLRYYPRAAFSGFFLGGRLGVYDVSAKTVDASGTFYGGGFDLGYTWLLGRKENVAISMGLGVNRLFGGDLAGASLAVPSIRLVNVGIAF